jgi:hypothetical protein
MSCVQCGSVLNVLSGFCQNCINTAALKQLTPVAPALSACYYVRANLTKVIYKQMKRDIITKTH